MKNLRIYWAAKLHGERYRNDNENYAALLRAKGYKVLLPQRHGVWEDMIAREKSVIEAHKSGLSPKELTRQAVDNVKNICYMRDMEDLRVANVCIAYCRDNPPREGASFELGYMHGRRRHCFLFIPSDEVYEEVNLMLTIPFRRFKYLDGLLYALADVHNEINGGRVD